MIADQKLQLRSRTSCQRTSCQRTASHRTASHRTAGNQWVCWLAIVAVAFTGCDSQNPPIEPRVATAPNASVPETVGDDGDRSVSLAPDFKKLALKLKFKRGDGKELFSIKPESDGGKLVDADDQEIARFKLQGRKLKIKTNDETTIGYIVASSGTLKVKSPDQQTTRWSLRKQSDGDWKLEDGDDKLIYKIKRRDYGFEIEDDSDRSLAKAKQKGEKTSLRNADDETLFYTKDPIKPEAVACLGYDVIQSMPIRVGLLTMVEMEAAQ